MTRYVSSELMLRAYIAEAAAAIVDGRLSAPMMVTLFSVTTLWPGSEPSTFPPSALAPISTRTEPAALEISALDAERFH